MTHEPHRALGGSGPDAAQHLRRRLRRLLVPRPLASSGDVPIPGAERARTSRRAGSPSGRPQDFPPGSVTFLPDRRLLRLQRRRRLLRISSVCTHLGCNVKRGGPGFRVSLSRQPVRRERPGRRTDRRRSRSPWYALTLSPRAQLVVDLDRAGQPGVSAEGLSGAPR